jgi:hypothetical protein
MTIQLDPGSLPDAQTRTYVSGYVNVVDDSTGSNVIVNIANVVNVSFSTYQPNVTITLSNNRIWVNGSYTYGNTSNIMWYNPPNSELTETPNIAYDYADVPPNKYVFQVNDTNVAGITVTHNFKVNYTAGGNSTFSIDRYVTPNIYAAYNFLGSYDWPD